VTRVLSLADASDRRLAAAATARGAALLYGFANFRALATLPSRSQAAGVTSDLSRMHLVFDWARLPRGLTPETVTAVMDDFHSLGPIGFRGPAASWVPEHLTVRDGGVRTVQHISPGVRCRSNALIADVLDRTGEDALAHFEVAPVAPELGRAPGVVTIGYADEIAVRATYRQHRPGLASIVSFHRRLARPGLVLERVGSLAIEDVRTIVARHGLDLVVAPTVGGATSALRAA
jgi:hypothetical protein